MTNKTEAIFDLTAPYDNPYQQQDRYARVLFVCSAGLLRSATGANLYAKKGYNTRSAGTHPYALTPLSANLIAWADRIVFVNHENYNSACSNFEEPLPGKLFEKLKASTVLDIPDSYEYNHPELIRHFEEQLDL
jgi:predicted protein tyrosine phosphatase